ncbi:hypothetical protein [Alistipes sp. ZOR0009]|uniref:hypothetical protein n=1 Tax=Alistipes sp. ZOR0009 TaxID=1339253 RepID=UPI000AB0F17A|nr:hypothetical protein [Alistipes sp. ZOR0009]
MKTLKMIAILLLIASSYRVAGQGAGTPVYDAKADFNETMKRIEEKSFKVKDWMYNLQQIQWLMESFKKMDTLRRHAQAAYDLSYKIYDNTKKVTALKDFGLNDVGFMAEKVIGMPIDPSFYLIRARGGKYDKFVKAVSFKPGDNIDQNSKDIYNFLMAYDPRYGASEGGNQIDIFDDIAKDFLFEEDWRKMVEIERARKIAKFRSSIAEEIEKKKNQIKLLQTDGKYSMTLAERLAQIEKLRNEAESLQDSLNRQNERISQNIKNKNKQLVLHLVGVKYNMNWKNFNKKIGRIKNIGDISLRKWDRSRKPIQKIVYNWK